MGVEVRHRISARSKKGSSLVETVCGSIILIAVALFLVDVAAMVICQTQNDNLAKHCALAAAAQSIPLPPPATGTNVAASQTAAQNAVNDVITQFNAQNGSSNLCVYQSSSVNYDTTAATAYVKTVVKCTFPVPIPLGPSSMSFQSDAYEPITAQLP